jgi:hypothetical protein
MLFPIDVSHLPSSMLIFLGVQTAVDVNHLLPSMLIFSLLVTGPEAKTKVLKTTLMLPKVQNAFLKKTSYF